MEEKEIVRTRYGTLFDDYRPQTLKKRYGDLFDRVEGNKTEIHEETVKKIETKMKFARRYGTLFDNVSGDGFIKILDEMKALRKEYIKRNSKEDEVSLRELDNTFVELIGRELQSYIFLAHKTDDGGLAVFIFADESLAQEFVKSNPGDNFSEWSYNKFTTFYGSEWKNIDNYYGVENPCLIIFRAENS